MATVEERLGRIEERLDNMDITMQDRNERLSSIDAAIGQLKINGAVVKAQLPMWKMVALGMGSFVTGQGVQALLVLLRGG